LLERKNKITELKKLLNECVKRLKNKEIRCTDQIYYSWILWNYKDIIEVQTHHKIYSFVHETLKNQNTIINKKSYEQNSIEIYGSSNLSKFSIIQYVITLDLLISFNKQKIIIPLETQSYINKKLSIMGWQDIINILNESINAFENENTGICCHNLRMALSTLLINIYEEIEGKDYPLESGKTPNIKHSLNTLHNKGLKDDLKGLISHIWSFVAERAHIEKSRGKKPNFYETKFCIKLVYSTIEFILKFLETIN
ncbi:MAG: hypothetical protein ACTSVV_12105, partial [Promethearchaeota archaeon]